MELSAKRSHPSINERTTPCRICGHLLSERHHLLPFAEHGETNKHIVYLCANCHEIYHLIYTAMFEHAKKNSHSRSIYLVGHLFLKRGMDDPLLRALQELAFAAIDFQYQELTKENMVEEYSRLVAVFDKYTGAYRD